MKYLQKNDFNPGLFHPFYFIRRGLFKKISENSSNISGRVLDFGCGSKPYRNLFKASEYIGVDFINEGHPHDREDIDIFYDGKKIPLPDGYFDSIICSEVVEHLFNLPEVLIELNRVLKPGGHVLVTCPFVWNEHEVPYDYARYTQFALRDIFEKSGFHVIRADKSGNFITTIFQLYNLYIFKKFYRSGKSGAMVNWLLKIFFVFPVNIGGSIARAIFPSDSSLYLNNIFLVQKQNDADESK